MYATLMLGIAFVLASAHPSAAATGSWSPRSSALWTRAGVVRVHAEIAPAAPVKPRPAPPFATGSRTSWAAQSLGAQRSDRRPPSSDRAHLSKAAAARLRTTALPDRRARAATLAALAGIFYEAHAPPSLS
jgi:hypothetical protein